MPIVTKDLGATDCHEVIESFIDQTYFVSIWRHENADGVFYSYGLWKLPEGHFSPRETKYFTTETPLANGGTYVRFDFGEILEDVIFDNLGEPLARLMKLTVENDRAI